MAIQGTLGRHRRKRIQAEELELGAVGSTVILSGTELSALADVTPGTVTASKHVVVDASKDISGFNDVGISGDLTVTGDLGVTGDITLTATSASTDGGVSVEPMVMSSTMTGAGGVGGRAKFQLDTNVVLGSWANALKAITVFDTNGAVTGLGSALVAEIELSAGTTAGTYAPLESELVLGTGAQTGTATSFLYMAASGADVGEFDDNGFLFEVAGITANTGHLLEAETGAVESTHSLRIRISGTTYYIPISTAQNFGS